MFRQIPNIFTLLNLVFGYVAIIYATQSGLIPIYDEFGNPLTNIAGHQYINIPAKIWLSSLFIGLAAIVDFLDGFIARQFKATSAMGKQLDSLADVVSFGVAPGIILYQFLRLSYAQQEGGMEISELWLVIAFLIPASAAWRLARFNLDLSEQSFFRGVPTPAVGLLIASLPLIYWNVNNVWVLNLLLNKWFLYGLILLLSYLMISLLPMMSLKFKDFSLKNNLPKYFLFLIAIISFIAFKWLSIPILFVAYVLVSLIFKNKIA